MSIEVIAVLVVVVLVLAGVLAFLRRLVLGGLLLLVALAVGVAAALDHYDIVNF